MTDALDRALAELEDAARELRSEGLDPDRGAQLVDRCVEIVGQLGADLERAARNAERDLPAQGQEQLL